MIPVRSINLVGIFTIFIIVAVQAMPRVMNDRTETHEIYDQRQKGHENWMVRIKNVYVTLPDLSKLFSSMDQMTYGDGTTFENCKEPYCLDVTDFVLNPKPTDESGASTNVTDNDSNEDLLEKPVSSPKPETKPQQKPLEKIDTEDVSNINFVNENPKRIPYFGNIPVKPASPMLDENFNLIRKKPQVEIISTPEPIIKPVNNENEQAIVEINTNKYDPIVEIGTKKVIQADKEIIIEIGNKRTTEIHPEVTEPSVVKVPEHHQPPTTTTRTLVEEPQILVEITEESQIGTTIPPVNAVPVHSRKNNRIQVIVEPDLSRVPIPAEEAVSFVESPAHEIKLVDISEALVALKEDIEQQKQAQLKNGYHIVPVQVMME